MSVAATPPTGAFDAMFDGLFAGNDDPWGFRSRWYEHRKRALTLACLPRVRYASGYEPGCANGELSAALAARCERFVASDALPRAVELARERLAGVAHAEVRALRTPAQWPDERFELIVFSEFGYYLDAAELAQMADRLATGLAPGGTVLACHWRHPIEGCARRGDEVHARLAARLEPVLCRAVSHMEPDLRIDVWTDDARSVAAHDGLVGAD